MVAPLLPVPMQGEPGWSLQSHAAGFTNKGSLLMFPMPVGQLVPCRSLWLTTTTDLSGSYTMALVLPQRMLL